MQDLENEKRLCQVLELYDKAAVAFSGGADSSLLLWYAVKVLGSDNVVAFTSRSCLLKKHELDKISNWFIEHDLQNVSHHFVDIAPLSWKEFTSNPSDRCYRCKSRVYQLFLAKSTKLGFPGLVDGTNSDDMQSDRPGLRALKELHVGSPLADAGLTKENVRSLSKKVGLKTWNRPSSSCLATRVPTGMEINQDLIDLIESAESVLECIGFEGCRVRLDPHDPSKAHIQVLEKDVESVLAGRNRLYVLEKMSFLGFDQVVLNLRGR